MTGLPRLQQPLLDKVKHIATLHLGVRLRDMLLDRAHQTLPAAAHSRYDRMVLAELPRPLDDGLRVGFEVGLRHRGSVPRRHSALGAPGAAGGYGATPFPWIVERFQGPSPARHSRALGIGIARALCGRSRLVIL